MVSDKHAETLHTESLEAPLPGGYGEDGILHGFTTTEGELPKGYYTSLGFIGTILGTGLGIACSVGGFGLVAPLLAVVDEDIGPNANIYWVSLGYTLSLAVGLLLTGRLGDLFGRRWLSIGGNILGLIGCIVGGTAKNIPSLIGAIVLVGLSAASQQCAIFIVAELVPMKYRFIIVGILFTFALPTSGFAPVVSQAFRLQTAAGWRWCFYLMIILNALAAILLFFFYYPPTFRQKFASRTWSHQLKHFDYIGTVLFIAGLLLFLMGLSWGGSAYPWKSAHVITCIVLGFMICVVFTLYEIYVPMEEPLVPMHLFRNTQWIASVLVLSMGASVYYAMAILWPEMVAVLYTDDGGASMHAGWLNVVPNLLYSCGCISGGLASRHVGKTKYQCMASLSVTASLLAAISTATPHTMSRAIGFLAIASFGVGWNDTVCLVNSGIEIDDPQEIGSASGVAGSIRSAVSTVASTVYLVVLQNRLASTIPAKVPAAVVAIGLPITSVAEFIGGFATGNFTGIPGVTPTILEAGTNAYKIASADAYSTVFLVTLTFSGIAIVASVFTPNVDSRMSDEVAVTLHSRNQEDQVLGTSRKFEEKV